MAHNPEPELVTCTLLTRQWRDEHDGLVLGYWAASARGPVRVLVSGEPAVCFIERDTLPDLPALATGRAERRPLDLLTLDGGHPVDGLYFRHQRELAETRGLARARGVHLFESDLKPADRFLMERFVTAGFEAYGVVVQRDGHIELVNPRLRAAACDVPLKTASIDIETEGLDGALYSIAATCGAEERVFLVTERPVHAEGLAVECHAGEAGVLRAFFAWLARVDPDVLIGWNVTGFDLDFMERRCRRLRLPFDVARGGERAAILPAGPGGTRVARLPGRVVLDGIDALRASFRAFERYDLESVAQTVLGRGKRLATPHDRVAEITRLYREAPARLALYNIEDCRLAAGIFQKLELVAFMRRRAELTGLPMDRQGGSVAAFDNLYLPRLHRRGRVAGDADDAPRGGASPGGYVMDSRPGLYENVLVLDFKSLYPSIIRTFHVDPLGLAEPGEDAIPGFDGARFARAGAILPELVENLWRARDEAKRARDDALSQAVKILMNSFYGVLGAYGCRFHDPRLASSITRRGHEIIRASRAFIERGAPHAPPRQVIYGDTDSLFVLLGPGIAEAEAAAEGTAIAARLNAWWRERLARELRLESALELQFERHFLKFVMPTVRGEDTGSKKRYAGLVRADGRHEVVFRGLESVRTDWTPLARRFQRELYRRVFMDEPYEQWLRDMVDELLAGRLDAELVYRKRLRRALDDYAAGAPPHVQAARKLARAGRNVSYVITTGGAEPVVAGRPLPHPDYVHYRERQLAPAADGILHFLGTSFAEITDAQMTMF